MATAATRLCNSISTSAELRVQTQALRKAHHEEVVRLHDRLGAVLKAIASAKAADAIAPSCSVCVPKFVNDDYGAFPASTSQDGVGEISASSSVSGAA